MRIPQKQKPHYVLNFESHVSIDNTMIDPFWFEMFVLIKV